MVSYEVHILESAELHGGKPGELKHVIWNSSEFDHWQDTAAGVSFWLKIPGNHYVFLSRTPQHHVHKVWVVDKVDPPTPEPAPYEATYDHLAAPYVDDRVMPVPTYTDDAASPTGELDFTRFEHSKFVRNADPDDLMVTRAEDDSAELTPIEYAMRVPGEPVEETREYVRSLVQRHSPLAPYSDVHLDAPSQGAASEIVYPLAETVQPDGEGKPKRRDTRGEATTFFFPVVIPPSHEERIPDDEGRNGT